MSELAVALLGYGTAGAMFHAPLITAAPGLKLTAVVTGNAARAAAARSRWPSARVLAASDEVFATAHHYDLIVVATPHTSHVPLTLQAVKAGLAVVVDKPLAISLPQAQALRAELDALGALGRVGVFHNRRWDGDFLTVQRLLREGALGEPHRLESRFERWRPEPRAGSWRELAPPGDGGGVLLDLGSHLVDQAVTLFGAARSVYAEVLSRRAGVSAGDDLFIALRHDGGAVSHLWATATAASPAPRFRLLGSAGAYTKYGLDVQEEQLRSGSTPADPDWGQEPSPRWGLLASVEGERRVATEPGSWQCFYTHVHAALSEGRPLPVPVEEVLPSMAALEMARISAAEQRVVEADAAPMSQWKGGA
ncbi:Gfo/Idh/MocA family oxidoreductase [Nonomuraea lactucae]|uniref:Gfo/Idh/MocA family protein n=1 Tax=Nonomuraea lactucae TaxID=2249762 RepID=UPI000DE328BD|nr:Gfo/Idh/MocA family oxidoreductase [Nonomuraea lactucae]